MAVRHVPRLAAPLLLALLWHVQPVAATTRRVPTDFSTIQAAVEASGVGDTVLVLPGTYHENILIRV